MDDLENCFLHLSRYQGMSDLREILGNYYNMLIFRGFVPSRWNSVATQRVIWITPDGVLIF